VVDRPGGWWSVPAADGSTGVPGGYGWDGGTGITWRTDITAGLTGILLTQRMMTSPEPADVATDFWAAAYAAIDARLGRRLRGHRRPLGPPLTRPSTPADAH
jgi:CubicO group peptidase (beta-lactamase class C family)